MTGRLPVVERDPAQQQGARLERGAGQRFPGALGRKRGLDPQGLEAQAAGFKEAGALVFFSLQDAVEEIFNRLPVPALPEHSPPIQGLDATFSAINAGLESFFESLRGQGAEAIQMNWRPPAGGNEKLAGILAKLKG